MELKQLATDIIKLVGGEKNIEGLEHCSTRLRFTIKDNKKVDENGLKTLDGVIGVIKGSAQLQVIIGNKVHDVCEEIYKQTNLQNITSSEKTQKEGNLFIRILAIIPRVFTPILPPLTACGLLKALIIIMQIAGVDTASSTFMMINFAADVSFYFLPIFVAVSASKIFKANTFMAILVVSALLHPTYSTMVSTAEPVTLFGLPIALVSYSSSMIPALLGVWVLSYVEKFFDKYIPELFRFILSPLCTFLVMMVLMFVAIGPLGYYCGAIVSSVLMSIYDVAGWAAIVLIAAFKPLLVMTGMHYALTTAFLTLFTATGVDKFYMSASILSNLAQSGATFGVFLKSKNKNTKSLALSTSFTALMGVTEPAMFGITLRYKKPFLAAMIAAAAGGLYAGLTGVQFIAMAGVGITGLLGVVPEFMIHMIIATIITLVISTVLAFIFGIEEEELAQETTHRQFEKKNIPSKQEINRYIASPLNGEVIDITQVPDPAFSSEAIGVGVAIQPTEGKVYAPADGVITSLFKSKHAIGITSDTKEEILIHVGLDTVQLKGEHFIAHIKQNDRVKKGDLLLEFDLKAIEQKGYSTLTPIVITNKNDYLSVFAINEKINVKATDPLLAVIDK